MASNFYAYMARMKFIKRWSLRRNTREENDQEHSLQVAMIAHALCEIRKKRLGEDVDIEKVLLLAIYHEAGEVITGDVATPIKYSSPSLTDAFKKVEKLANRQLLEYLPEDFREDYEPLLLPDESSVEWKIVKAADRISAYVKCVEERGYGNEEFRFAEETVKKSIFDMKMVEADIFMREFAPAFSLPLDGLNQ